MIKKFVVHYFIIDVRYHSKGYGQKLKQHLQDVAIAYQVGEISSIHFSTP